MNPQSSSAVTTDQGATVVITHRVRADKHAEYEQWLETIAPLCKAATGHLDWHIVRPIAGLTETYTVVIRFDTEQHLRQWIESADRSALIEQVKPLFVSGDDFFISSGLDFWFMPAGAKAKVPLRWKQYLLTLSAIYPLALIVPMLVHPAFISLHVPQPIALFTLVVTAIVVFLMVYVVMPRYTRLMQHWLFK